MSGRPRRPLAPEITTPAPVVEAQEPKLSTRGPGGEPAAKVVKGITYWPEEKPARYIQRSLLPCACCHAVLMGDRSLAVLLYGVFAGTAYMVCRPCRDSACKCGGRFKLPAQTV